MFPAGAGRHARALERFLAAPQVLGTATCRPGPARPLEGARRLQAGASRARRHHAFGRSASLRMERRERPQGSRHPRRPLLGHPRRIRQRTGMDRDGSGRAALDILHAVDFAACPGIPLPDLPTIPRRRHLEPSRGNSPACRARQGSSPGASAVGLGIRHRGGHSLPGEPARVVDRVEEPLPRRSGLLHARAGRPQERALATGATRCVVSLESRRSLVHRERMVESGMGLGLAADSGAARIPARPGELAQCRTRCRRRAPVAPARAHPPPQRRGMEFPRAPRPVRESDRGYLVAMPSAPSAIVLCDAPDFKISIDTFGRRKLELREASR